MEIEDKKRLFNACQPDRPLEPRDPRYVEIDGPDARPRRYDWVEHIAGEFRLQSEPTLLLLTGLPGTGKSTELKRVVEVLADPRGAHLFPIWIDAAEVINLHERLEFHELVFAVLAQTERTIAQTLEGDANAEVAHEGVLARLWAWVTKTEVELTKFEIGKDGSNLVFELRSNPSFKKEVKTAIAKRRTEFEAKARAHMQELRERAKRVTSHEDLIVVFDSLEQLRGVRDDDEILSSAEDVFGKQLRPQTLGVHAIFTVPVALATRRMLEIRFMPLIKISEKDGTTHRPGHEAMRRMVTHRLSDADLLAVFGPHWSPRIDRLIERSGGYARELIRMLQDAIKSSDLPLPDHDFDIVLAERADRYRRLVPRSAHALLHMIHTDHPPLQIPDPSAESAKLMELLLTNNLLMVYQNDEEWTDVNPAIVSLVGAPHGA